MANYRVILAEEGEVLGEGAPLDIGDSAIQQKKKQKGYSRAEVNRILESGGHLSWAQLLRCKTRYFTDGAAIGSKAIVGTFFQQMKKKQGGCATHYQSQKDAKNKGFSIVHDARSTKR